MNLEQKLLDNWPEEHKDKLAAITKDYEQESKLDKIIKALEGFVSKDPFKPTEHKELEVVKSLEDEKRLAMFVVLAPEEEDLHGDIYSAEEIEKACNNFNQFCGVANLFHTSATDSAEIVQSFTTPSDFMTEDGRTINKGSWLQWMHFPEGNEESDALWDLVKSGEINGLSVGCKALVEEL